MKSPKLDVEESLVKTNFRGIEIYMPANYKELDLKMGYEKSTIDLFIKLIKPGSVFVDVGTHVGFFTILGGRGVGPNGKVYSFEPILENITALKKNIALNKLKNVTIINEALSSASGVNTFKIRKDTGLSGFYDHPLGETVRQIKIKTSTLDELFRNKRVDFIKIDTEGNELNVLKGAVKTLKNNPEVTLIVELNPGSLKNAGDSPTELLKFITALGFEIYSIDDETHRIHRLTKKYERWEEDFPSYGYSNLLCVQKGLSGRLLQIEFNKKISTITRPKSWKVAQKIKRRRNN